MNPKFDFLQSVTRRHFLKTTSQLSLGTIALANLLGRDTQAAAPKVINPLAPKEPPFQPKVKRVIYLHMSGGPPHLDLFDYKPKLVKWDSKPCPDEFIKGKRFAFTSGVPKLMGTPRQFAQHGKAGVWMWDAIPKLAEVADEVCLILSMNTDQINHTQAELLPSTRYARQGPR